MLTDGHGPDVLLFGSPADDAGAWEPQLAALTPAFRMTRYDVEETGDAAAPYSQASLVEDALAVLDATDIERAHVVGAALGGVIAQMLAIYHPERVASITLSATWGRPDDALRERYAGWRWAAERADSICPLLEHDTRVLLACVPLPALVVAGASDALGAAHSRELATLLRNGRLELVDGAGGRPHAEQPDAFNDLLRDFLARASSAPAVR